MAQAPNVIMVAAGQSRRMGDVNKLLIPINGIPLIRRSAQLYRSFSPHVAIVTGYQADLVTPLIDDLDVTIIRNIDYDQGQQSSVLEGLKQMKLQGDTPPAVMIALADQYCLTTADLTQLYKAFLNQKSMKVTIPKVAKQRGNPVIFPASTLACIQGQQNQTLRGYIDSHPDELYWHETSNTRYITDLDTPEDVKRAQLTLSSEWPQQIFG